MTFTKEEFLGFSVFLNFNFSENTTKEFIRLNIGNVADIYKKGSFLSVSAKEEVNKVLKLYNQEILRG